MGVILGQNCLCWAEMIVHHIDHLVMILLQSYKVGLIVHKLYSIAP